MLVHTFPNILKLFKMVLTFHIKFCFSARADLGAYQCVVVIFPTSEVEKQTVRTKPSYLKGKLELNHPILKVSWP